MKNGLGLILSGMLGGLVVLVGFMTVRSLGDKKPESSYRTYPVSYRAPQNSAVPFDFTVAAEKTMPAVVHIKAVESVQSVRERVLKERRNHYDPFSFFFGQDDPRRYNRSQVGFGSGVILNEDGLIVTNNHVVDFADELEVTLHDNRSFKARLIGTDPKSDLALIKMEGEDFPFIDIGNSDEVKVGQWVVAVGNPFDLTSTVTAGIISAKGRSNILKTENAVEDFIQTDAVVNPGNSGGALVDIDGNLIGINTAIASPDGIYAGYAFAIPSNLVGAIIDDIQKNAKDKKNKPGYLGVDLEEVDDYAIKEYRLSAKNGVLIVAIDKEGPAYLAGLNPGDVIVEIDDKPIKTLEQTSKIMKEKFAGDKVVFKVIKRGRLSEVPVILRDR